MTPSHSDAPPRHDVPRGGRSGFVLVDDRQVHYLEWGPSTAPPVLCLHGGGQTAYMYEELGDALRDRYHVLAPDLPWHGDSDPIDDMGRQTLAESIPPLMHEFGFDRAAFVGASLGGIVSMTLAAARRVPPAAQAGQGREPAPQPAAAARRPVGVEALVRPPHPRAG
jgi:pimeloyl-ACP methyl ester carboxylesterase